MHSGLASLYCFEVEMTRSSFWHPTSYFLHHPEAAEFWTYEFPVLFSKMKTVSQKK